MEEMNKSTIQYIDYRIPISYNNSNIFNSNQKSHIAKFFESRDKINSSLDNSFDPTKSRRNVSFTDDDIVLFIDHSRLLKKKLNNYYYHKIFILFFGEDGLVPAIDFYFYYVHNNKHIFENLKKMIIKLNNINNKILRNNIYRWDDQIKIFIIHEKAIIIQNYIKYKLSQKFKNPKLSKCIKLIELFKLKIAKIKFNIWVKIKEYNKRYSANVIQSFSKYTLAYRKIRLMFRMFFLRNMKFELYNYI